MKIRRYLNGQLLRGALPPLRVESELLRRLLSKDSL